MNVRASASRRFGLIAAALLIGSMLVPNAEAGLGRWFYSWGTTNGQDANLGPADDRTCFLSGIAGNLNAGATSWGPGWPSKADVTIFNGGWWLHASGGGNSSGNPIGNPVLAHAVCINTVAGRTPNVKWQSDWGKTLVAPVTSKRQCFLTGIWGVGASWTDGDDHVRVTNDGTNWWIDGAVNTSQLGNSRGYASARCVDMPTGTSVSSWTWFTNDPGSWTPNVGYDSTGMACALTGVQGHFTANDWTDGALINWPTSFPGYWKVALKNGKKAWVTCMQ